MYLSSELKSEEPVCLSVLICSGMAALRGGGRFRWPSSTGAGPSNNPGINFQALLPSFLRSEERASVLPLCGESSCRDPPKNLRNMVKKKGVGSAL